AGYGIRRRSGDAFLLHRRVRPTLTNAARGPAFLATEAKRRAMSRMRRTIATGLGALVSVSAIGLIAVAVAVAAKFIRPVAVTQGTSQVGPYKVTLHGQSGPGVPGGDITTYHFNYGKTTSYGLMTPPGKVGSCPSGQTSCPGVPATQSVSARIHGLAPCT